MLFKFLWFLVLVWIIGRVFRSAVSIFRIAAGQEDATGQRRAPYPGPDARTFSRDTAGGSPAPDGATVHRRPAPAATSPPRPDVEDARFEDL